MCLYGNDIDETTSPVEANLSWLIGMQYVGLIGNALTLGCDLAKERRTKGAFIGSETVLEQVKKGVTRRRVGLIVEGPPARGMISLVLPRF
jgi:aminomethyltransferase